MPMSCAGPAYKPTKINVRIGFLRTYVLVRFGEFEKGGLRTTASGASSFVPSSTECCRLL